LVPGGYVAQGFHLQAVTETIENIEMELETLLKGYQKKLGLKYVS
jgi:hypothetical protein